METDKDLLHQSVNKKDQVQQDLNVGSGSLNTSKNLPTPPSSNNDVIPPPPSKDQQEQLPDLSLNSSNNNSNNNNNNSSSGSSSTSTNDPQSPPPQQHYDLNHPLHHTAFEGYSGRNKVPTIAEYEDHVRQQKEQKEKTTATEGAGTGGWFDWGGTGGNTGKSPTSEEKQQQQQQRQRQHSPSSPSSPANQKSQGQQEKEEMMKRLGQQQGGRPIDKVTKKGERIVYDPVTAQDVLIKDADFKDYFEDKDKDKDKKESTGSPRRRTSSVTSANKNNNNNKSQSPQPRNSISSSISSAASRIAPSHVKTSNILLQQFPPPVNEQSSAALNESFNQLALVFSGGLAVIWFFTAFGNGFFKFGFRTFLCAGLGIGTWLSLGLWHKRIEKDIERMRHDLGRQRGEKYSPPTPESVEWLNAYIKVFWGLINAEEMFRSVVDMIEDIMQASLPQFVDAVKISDVSQGSNPIRIVSMRALPDQPGDKNYPNEEWITQKTPEEQNLENKNKGSASSSSSTKSNEFNVLDENNDGKSLNSNGSDDEDDELNDQSGDYVNMEVSFVYQALPGQSGKSRNSNIHLLVQFFLGLYDWLHIPIPIWIQVEGIAGTARVRLQMIQEPPYVRNLTFTLMGVPAVDVSAIPMTKKLPNVLDLPVVSSFFKSAVSAGTAEYCAPKSMTLNLQEILSGTGVKMDTKAVGVFVVTIHHAENLSVQDTGGSSDPYIVVAYAKFGKPLYSTRIIFEDLNPVFEETCFLLLDEDTIQSDEQLSLTLWDNDKHSADDLIGRVQIPVRDLIKHPNKLKKRTDTLKGFEDADSMLGQLTWSVGYYEKARINPYLSSAHHSKKQEHIDAIKEKVQNPLPTPVKETIGHDHEKPEQKSETEHADKNDENKDKEDAKKDENDENDSSKEEKEKEDTSKHDPVSVLNTKPETKYPSGILSVIIHHINSLERQNLKGSTSGKEGDAGQDTDEPTEQAANLPNSYCEIILNDDMVYKTRVKQYSSMPFFEAGTERFVRDWTTSVVRVVVRDARLREHDPVLGIVNVNLKELFSGSSQVTRLFALQEGVGFGRANISFLWRSIKAKLPRNQLGWDTGTVQITSPIKVIPYESSVEEFSGKTLKVWTSDIDVVLPGKSAKVNNGAVIYELQESQSRVPIYRRHQSALIFEVGGKNGFISVLGSKPKAIAVLWLRDIVDEEITPVELDLLVAEDPDDLRQNALNDFTAKHHEYKAIGQISFDVLLDAGLDPDHEIIASRRGQASRHTFDAYDRIEGQATIAERNSHANDDGVIDKQEKKEIRRAHKRALALRHRGPMQYAPYRSTIWVKDGLKARGARLKRSLLGSRGHHDDHKFVESEA